MRRLVDSPGAEELEQMDHEFNINMKNTVDEIRADATDMEQQESVEKNRKSGCGTAVVGTRRTARRTGDAEQAGSS